MRFIPLAFVGFLLMIPSAQPQGVDTVEQILG
jgi:hypothetical protein